MAKRVKILEIGEVEIWEEKLRILVSRYPAGGQVFVGLQVKAWKSRSRSESES